MKLTALAEATLGNPRSTAEAASKTATQIALDSVCAQSAGADGASWSASGPIAAGGRNWILCQDGVAAGSTSKMLLRSEDNGVTWSLISRTTFDQPASQPEGSSLPNAGAVESLVFADANSGWMVLRGPGVNLARTSDGGATWTLVGQIGSGMIITSYSFERPPYVWFRAGDAENKRTTVWVSADGGNDWVSFPQSWTISDTLLEVSFDPCAAPRGRGVEPIRLPLSAVFALDAQTGWALCQGLRANTTSVKQLYRTDGEGWRVVSEFGTSVLLGTPEPGVGKLPAQYVSQMAFADSLTGFLAVSEPGPSFFVTHDGGASWSPAAPDQRTGLGFRIDSPTRVLLATRGGIWLTEDGGTTWRPAGPADF